MKGHVGPCVLRSLKYFDVGISFLSDTLHNIYHGVMVSIFTKIVKIYVILCVFFHCHFLSRLCRNAYCAYGLIVNTVENHGHSIQKLNRRMNICRITYTLQIRQECRDHFLSSTFLKVMNIDLCYYLVLWHLNLFYPQNIIIILCLLLSLRILLNDAQSIESKSN